MSLTPVIIDRLRGMGIPTNSFTAAAYHVRDVTNPKAAGIKGNFDRLISAVTELEVPTKNLKEAELVLGYIIQESVRSFNANQFMEVEDTVTLAKKKTTEFLVKNPWLDPIVIAEKHEAAVVAHAEAGTTAKKPRVSRASGMSKKDRCLALFNQHKAEFGDDKHKMIDLFMKELELSKPGATTYEYNCRKGIWK